MRNSLFSYWRRALLLGFCAFAVAAVLQIPTARAQERLSLSSLQAQIDDLDVENETQQIQIDDLTARVEALEAGGPADGVLEGNFSIGVPEDIQRFCERYEQLTGSLFIVGTNLENLDGLTCLREIGEALFIRDNPLLTDIDGLSNLVAIGDVLDGFNRISIHIEFSPVESLRAFFNLTTLSGEIRVRYANLRDLEGLQNLTSARTIWLSSMPALSSITSIANISSLGTLLLENIPISRLPTFRLSRLPSLTINGTNLQDLRGLESVTEGTVFQIAFNSLLSSLQGLENLRELSGGIRLVANDALTDLSGLNSLTLAGVFEIRTNASLTSLAPLTGVTMGSIVLEENPVLSSLVGFDPVQRFNSQIVRINDNDSLVDLAGLESFAQGTIFGIEIRENDVLTSVSSLQGFAGLTRDLTIVDNPVLPTAAEAEALRDAIGVGNIAGTITISGNGPG